MSGAAARSTRSGPAGAACSPHGNAWQTKASPECGIGLTLRIPAHRSCHKEELRTLLSTVRVGGDPHLARHRLHRCLAWCIDSQIPELPTLATTIDSWWPEVNTFLVTGITNARTEGYNRLLKQVKCVGCGFRNREHSTRRIRFHCTRKRRAATQISCLPPVAAHRKGILDVEPRLVLLPVSRTFRRTQEKVASQTAAMGVGRRRQ